MNLTEINLMLGGDKTKELDKSGVWIGVDSGTQYLLDNHIVPLFSVGDFDSFNIENSYDHHITIIKKENQDLTDTEFALLNVIKIFPHLEQINIFGATGKRLDHFFANILLLSNDKFINYKINLIDNHNIIFLSKTGHNSLVYDKSYKYISFVPITANTIVSIKNAKYEVENYKLTLDRANATSNEFKNENEISFITNHRCLIIYSKDKE